MQKIYNFFFKNFLAKLTCVFLAVALWLYVGTGQTRNAFFPGQIPLQIRNTPQGLVAVTDTDTIQAKIMATNDIFNKLTNESFNAYLDLAGLKEGTYNLKPTVTVNLAGVTVIETNPSTVVVSIEPSISKDVPVSPLVTGKAGEGLVAGQTQADPSTVTVSGARSVIEGIIEATAPIELSGQTSDFKQMVRLVALNSNGKTIKGVNFSPGQVIVTVPIVKASNVKTVGVKVNIVGSPASGYWITQVESDPKTVTVTASEQTIVSLSYIPTAQVSVNNLSKNTTLTTTLSPPSGVNILDSVSQVKVTISIGKNQTSRQMDVGFQASGIASNLKVTSYDPISATVVVTGPQDVLAGLSSSDISIIVNVSGISSPGTYSIDISRANISGPPGVSISSIVPSAINVRLDTK